MIREPPLYLDNARVIAYAVLGVCVQSASPFFIILENGTRIYPSYVAICQYDDSHLFYRFYCDNLWEVLTDIDYTSLQEAQVAVTDVYHHVHWYVRD